MSTLRGRSSSEGGASAELNLLLTVEKLGSNIVATVEDAEVKKELKKVNMHLRQIVRLKKYANAMAAVFILV
jgi:hypothetical protein